MVELDLVGVELGSAGWGVCLAQFDRDPHSRCARWISHFVGSGSVFADFGFDFANSASACAGLVWVGCGSGIRYFGRSRKPSLSKYENQIFLKKKKLDLYVTVSLYVFLCF